MSVGDDISSGVGRYVDVGRGVDVAFDPELDREVLLERSDAIDQAGVAALRRKSRALATVVHPAITRVHDVVVGDDGVARVVVERPRGVTLARWCASRPALARRLAVLLGVSEGIVAIHAAGIVHGSLELATIMVEDGDAARITGLLRRAGDGSVRGDRQALCELALAICGDDLRRQPTARHRRLLAALRQGAGDGAEPPLAIIRARLAAGRRAPRRAELALVLATVGALGWAAVRPADEPTSWCDDIDRRLDAVWSPSTRQALRAGLLATGVDYAAQTADTIDRDLDAFARRWQALQHGRCSLGAADTAVAVCLYRKFDGLRAVVDSLTIADGDSIAHAIDAVAALGSPDECTDGGAAVLAIAAGAAISDEIRAELVAAESLRELGRYAQARAAAERAVAAAQRTDSPAALAEAQCLLAQALIAQGEEAEAERYFHESFTTGLAAGHDAVVARAAAELAFALARRGDLDDAEMWRDHAIAAGARVLEPRLRARVAAISARVSFERSDYREAVAGFGRALELAEATEPRDLAAVLHARQSLAITHGRLGDRVRALELLERNAADTAARYGAEHPDYGREANSVATELGALGRTTEAVAMRRRAVDVLVRAVGPTHPDTLAARSALATDLVQTGERADALGLLREIVADAEARLGHDDPRTIGHLAELGMTESLLEHGDDAIVHLADAAKRGEAVFGPDHAEVLGILTNLAATHMFAGHDAQASALFDDVIARTERKLGADHPQLVPALLGAARTRRSADQIDAAITMLERARGILGTHVERPDRIAQVDFDLAQLLWEQPGSRARAVALARGAHQRFVLAHGQGFDSAQQSADNVTEWLATHANP